MYLQDESHGLDSYAALQAQITIQLFSTYFVIFSQNANICKVYHERHPSMPNSGPFYISKMSSPLFRRQIILQYTTTNWGSIILIEKKTRIVLKFIRLYGSLYWCNIIRCEPLPNLTAICHHKSNVDFHHVASILKQTTWTIKVLMKHYYPFHSKLNS